jgi:hypothetical protein
MTKKGHYCDVCKGVDGEYIKVCRRTREQIETYKEQLIRQTKDLLGKTVKHRPGIDEH